MLRTAAVALVTGASRTSHASQPSLKWLDGVTPLRASPFKARLPWTTRPRLRLSWLAAEVRRNCGDRGYRPQQEHQRAQDKRQHAEKHIKFVPELEKIVTEKILLDWSPDQISGYLQKENIASISHERIYQFLIADDMTGEFSRKNFLTILLIYLNCLSLSGWSSPSFVFLLP